MNKKKGFTLVEVLVSMTLFLITFLAIVSCINLGVKKVQRYEEFQYIENICLDIDKVYDSEGYQGLVNYYGFNEISDNTSSGEIYFDQDYKLVKTEYKYVFSYKYSNSNDVSLLITVTQNQKNYVIINELEYGHSKYDDSQIGN